MPNKLKEENFVGKGSGSSNRSFPSHSSKTKGAPKGVNVSDGKAKGKGGMRITKMMQKGKHHTT